MEHFENATATRQANIIRNANCGRYYKVVARDELGNVKILATHTSYNVAVNMANEFCENRKGGVNMTNNTSKYSATLDALKSIKHINNMLRSEELIGHKIALIESKEDIMHILYFNNPMVWEKITRAKTWADETGLIDFYISLYELAERGRVEIFTKKEGE